jgi:hypothetical protein
VFITSTVVDVEFLDSIRLGQLNDNQFMCVKRSVKFDLAEKEGSIDAAKAVIGL